MKRQLCLAYGVLGLIVLACSAPTADEGDASDDAAEGLRYRQPPTLASITPATGPAAGGTTVDLAGSYLRSGSSVYFGGNISPQVTWVSSSLLRVVTPPHVAGTVDVVLRDTRGNSVTLPGSFQYTTTSSTPPPSGDMKTVAYTATTDTFPNPERGFYHEVDCSNGLLSLTQLKNYRASLNDSLVMCKFHLDAWVSSPIPQSALDFFDQQMGIVRSSGLKIVMRFAYNNTDSAIDAPLTQLLAHIDQLAPHIAANKDVITVVQAGFIGSWGEWANSQHYGTYPLNAQNLVDRKTIANKLLANVPLGRFVQVRTPAIAENIIGDTVPLTDAEAFGTSAKARLGQHNDCFLASTSDVGTYTNISVDYPWLEAETKHLPMGGETCRYTSPRSDCPTALDELARFHWSYLHADYNLDVVNAWKTQGCFDQIKQRLGYRFALQSGSFSATAKVGGAFRAVLAIQNQGWSATYNTRAVELAFRNVSTGTVYRVPVAADPRTWQPGTTTVDQTITLPAAMTAGDYAVLLALPDPEPSLHDRPEYAARFANAGWEATTGLQALGYTVTVSP